MVSNLFNEGLSVKNDRWYISNTYFKGGYPLNKGSIQGDFLFKLNVNPYDLHCNVELWDLVFNQENGTISEIYKGTFQGRKID